MRRMLFYMIISGTILLILTGCYSTRKITIQVLHPPDKIVFNTPQNIMLVNRMLRDSSRRDTLHFVDLNIPLKMYYDLGWKALYGFADVAAGSPWVKNIFFDSVYVDSVSPAGQPGVLPFAGREKMFRKNQATVGVDLAKMIFSDSIYRSTEFVYYDEGDDLDGEWLTVLNVNLYIKTFWFIYEEKNPEPVDSTEHTNTLNLNGAGRNYRQAVSNLPNIRKAVADLAYQAGQHHAYHIFPVWDEVSRIYFVNKTDRKMKEAENLAQKNQWMDAASIWKEMTFSRNRKKAAMAAFNMALASEINDKLDLAESWLEKSLKLEDTQVTRDYLEIIRERLRDYKKMNLRTSE